MKKSIEETLQKYFLERNIFIQQYINNTNKKNLARICSDVFFTTTVMNMHDTVLNYVFLEIINVFSVTLYNKVSFVNIS